MILILSDAAEHGRYVLAAALDPDGKPIALHTNASGALVTTGGGGGGGGTSSVFGDVFPDDGTAVGALDESGNMAPLRVNPAGELKIAGSFSTTPVKSSTATTPALNTIGTTAEVILAANADRVQCMIQNVGTTRLYIAFGFTPTVTNYHLALPACGEEHDGSSQAYIDATWVGAISAISSASGGLVQASEWE